MAYDVAIEFVVDTGADTTYIVHQDEIRLQFAKEKLVEVPGPVSTLGGVVDFVALPHCHLVFWDVNHNPYGIEDLSIYFLSPSFKRKQRVHLAEGTFPSVLGRDVIEQLALGYCREKGLLCLTDQHQEFTDALLGFFQPPPEDNNIRWIG
jgi:hypothetical protein